MPLSEHDVHEILRIIDSSPLAELRVETDGFALHVVKGGRGAASELAAAPAAPAATPARAENLVTVEAPMLGVFYRAEGPGERPFVEPGSRVEPNTTVCIIEVMKMMNSVAAGVEGTVIEVCQENGAIVEEGAPLFRIAQE